MTSTPSNPNTEKELQKATKLRFLKRQKRAERFTNNDILGMLSLTTISINLLVLLGLLLLLRSYTRLANKPAPSLVQMTSGEAIEVRSIGSKERTPDVILNFSKDTLSLLLTWTGSLPNPDGGDAIPDRGVKVPVPSNTSDTALIATSAFEAGFALSEDFRKEFLVELGQIMPSSVFQSSAQVVFVPLEIGQLTQIEPGKWRLSVVANLMVFDSQHVLGKPITFNKEIFIQAVEVPEFDEDLTGFAQAVQQIRASGLEIYSIRDL